MFNRLFKRSWHGRKVIIFCRKCQLQFDRYLYYCKYYYDKKTKEEKNGKCKGCFRPCTKRNWCSSCENQIVFKTTDYDLDLNGRKAKFKEYDLIFCGKCKQKFGHDLFYCEYCYNNETNKNERNRMLGEKCKVCFQPCTEHNWCSSCGFQNNGNIKKQIVFKTEDYKLNMDKRKVKYKDHDLIFCEECQQQFDRYLFYCDYCYNKKTNEEKNRMLHGKCKGCSQACTESNWCSSCGFQNNDNIEKQMVFKTTDYDLNRDERKIKFKDYDFIFCGECERQFGHDLFYCKYCFYRVDENERIRMLGEKCKGCFQPCTRRNWCSSCGFQDNENIEKQTVFKITDYDLDLNGRKAKFKGYDLIFCGECQRQFDRYLFYCEYCYDCCYYKVEKSRMLYGTCKKCFKELLQGCLPCRFKQDFDKWTSGNKNIDKLIRESQISARDFFGILEWIPYDRFTNIKFIAEGGFAKVYSAIWIDGYIKDWELNWIDWKRCGSFKVALKVLNNSSENISEDFLNEIKSLKIFPNVYSGVITFYGITREPTTRNYALVFKLEDSGLRHYLIQNYNLFTWEGRLYIIQRICSGLRSIHNYGLIHKDFHIGNILHSILNDQSFTYIGDFGFCIPANETSSKSNIYGVMPYMAPEILRGKPYTKAADIYSLGIIINEIISIIPPFNEEPHDYHLALDICHGKRPKIREETPEFLKELIKKCWDANPENRPSSDEIDTSISDFIHEKKSKELKELSYDSINKLAIKNSSTTTQIFKSHPEAIYTSRLLNLPNLPEPVNCQNQEEFVSSRNITQVQSGEVYILDYDECFDCAITN